LKNRNVVLTFLTFFHNQNFFIIFRYAVILAFDVKIERDAQELADNLGVRIFQVCYNILKYFYGSHFCLESLFFFFCISIFYGINVSRLTLFIIFLINSWLTGMS